ncbi:MAG: GNAT family N-acetyltransferase [Actinomycetales bacterium]
MPADLEGVLEVGRRAWRDRFEPIAGSAYVDAGLARYWTDQKLAREIGAGEVLVAATDKVVLGMATVRSDGGDNHFLARLYVDPAAQGSGVGSALLDAATAQCAGTISLTVLSVNHRARDFYERHGFLPTGQEVEPDGGPPQLHMIRE